MKKSTIPNADRPVQALLALKNNLDYITGRTNGEIKLLSATATNADIINKINEIAAKINYST